VTDSLGAPHFELNLFHFVATFCLTWQLSPNKRKEERSRLQATNALEGIIVIHFK
jgi:hypothetical protein